MRYLVAVDLLAGPLPKGSNRPNPDIDALKSGRSA